jgi:hypothetical protein
VKRSARSDDTGIKKAGREPAIFAKPMSGPGGARGSARAFKNYFFLDFFAFLAFFAVFFFAFLAIASSLG